MTTEVNTIEDELMNENTVASIRTELAQIHLRAFTREAVIACMVLTGLGVVALLALLLGEFEVSVATAKSTQMTGMYNYSGAFRPDRNITPLVMGAAAAAFSAALIVAGGALPQLKRLPLSTVYLLGGCGGTSFLGLLVLALTL
ncbi:MAG: hypothetical protein IPP14_03670 [Planctomycetes bacterium]|nr:hypothetical protein [Planctomycetota bacterium]